MPFVVNNGRPILFIHIPKNGGGTIEHWLGSIGTLNLITYGMPNFLKITPQHLSMNDIRLLFSEDFFSYRFAIIRDPYARVESEYKQQALIGSKSFWKTFMTFSQWIEHCVNNARSNKYFMDNHWRPQVDFIGSGVRLFRFEDGLESIVEQVCHDTGLKFSGELIRKHDTSAFKDAIKWDLQDRILVNEFYRLDFDAFEYKKIVA